MDRDEIEDALRELSDELVRQKVTARICIIGGAAMVLGFNSRYSTADIDADFYPTDEIVAAAKKIASRRKLPKDWLNNFAKGFLPAFKEPDWRPVLKIGNIDIVTADERTMLAMKLRASRGSRDIEDIKFLVNKCGIESEQEALALYDEYFPEDPLPPRAKAMLSSALQFRPTDTWGVVD
jgi:predicted nucleotidyltransferase